MDGHLCPADIFVMQSPRLSRAKSGGIHQGDDRSELQIRDRRQEFKDHVTGRDKREIGIKLPEGKLGRIPVLMENVDMKEAELGDGGIDGTVRKISGIFQPFDKGTHLIPGNIFWFLMKD